MKLGRLRQLIKLALDEGGGGWASPPQPAGRHNMSPEVNNREAIQVMKVGNMQDVDELPPHLRDPYEDPEDCFGPVPPNAEEPGVHQDPFVRDSSPLPGSSIKR